MKRSRFSEEQIIGVLEAHEAWVSVADLRRKHGISGASIYNWTARFAGMDVSEARRLKTLGERPSVPLRARHESTFSCGNFRHDLNWAITRGEVAMDTKYGFTRLSVAEFKTWIAAVSVSRVITSIQEHHTWRPSYSSFSRNNHFEMQRNMKNYHVGNNGWADIGQHFSIFPDGIVVTGRPMNKAPACIYGNNAGSICIENVGNFDAGKDTMSPAQGDAIVQMTGALAKRFNLNPVTTNNIVYHHWFDLNTGARRNGAGTTKSCPGTAFFGGNTVAACHSNFLPLVQAALGNTTVVAPIRYGRVVAPDPLNVRVDTSAGAPLATDQAALETGSIVRIFDERNRWLRISNSKQYWIYSRYVEPVEKRTVNTDDSKVRTGPGTSFAILDALMKGTEVFVGNVSGGWGQIGVGDEWISLSLIN